jgi:hypothetical protein
MSENGKKKRRSRKTKEEKMMEKLAKEQQENEKQEETQEPRPPVPFQATPEQQKLIETPDINQKMLDMDVRIKYGFIKTLHNNLLSINRRINWEPDELFSIGMIFRDLQSIELSVLNTVVSNEENSEDPVDEDEEEEEEEEQEETEDVN